MTSCNTCGESFESRNQLFKQHLVGCPPTCPAQLLGGGGGGGGAVPDGAHSHALGYFFGPWVTPQGNGCIPVQSVAHLTSGEKVYMVYEAPYTKMVTAGDEGRYFTGPLASFDASKWDTYDRAPPKHYNFQASLPPETVNHAHGLTEVVFNAGGDGVVGTCDACESELSDGTRLFLCARRDELQCNVSFCLACIRGQRGPAFSLVAPEEAIALSEVADLPTISFVAVRGDWDLCPSMGAFHPVPNIEEIQAGSWGTDRLAGVIEATDNMYIANMVETKPDGGKLGNFYANATGEKPVRYFSL